MNEDFLQFAWKFRLFNSTVLSTESGDSLEVIHPGTHNFNGGPDFLDARLKIGGQTWAGHVEVHIRAGDWHRHGHQHDEHYQNVILHVVHKIDREVSLFQNGDLQVLDLSKYLGQEQFKIYDQWMNSCKWIPCQDRIMEIDHVTWTGWKERMMIEKLESKYHGIIDVLKECNGDWTEVFYRRLARNFGFKVNAQAMEMLAATLPFQLLSRHRDSPLSVNALFYGQAGLLEKASRSGYPGVLLKEYRHLRKKYALQPLSPVIWNFSRMRPLNFPTIRIAQLAALICETEHLFSALVETEELEAIPGRLVVPVHEFWDQHYTFPPRRPSSLFGENNPRILLSRIMKSPVDRGHRTKE